MRRMPLALAGAILVISAVRIVALEPSLDTQGIQDAIAIGQSSIAADRLRFNEAYRITAGKPPVDYVYFVTPFRRVEQAAEERREAGDRTFGQRQAREALDRAPNGLDVIVELTFNPLNTYVGVPEYAIFLVPTGGDAIVEASSIDRIPRFGPRVAGQSSSALAPPRQHRNVPGQPVLGGTLIAHFDVRQVVANGAYDVLIVERVSGGKPQTEIARVRVDLSRMR